MDPLSALSLASNNFKLVDLGTRMVWANFELYSPDRKSTNRELETIMVDLRLR